MGGDAVGKTWLAVVYSQGIRPARTSFGVAWRYYTIKVDTGLLSQREYLHPILDRVGGVVGDR